MPSPPASGAHVRSHFLVYCAETGYASPSLRVLLPGVVAVSASWRSFWKPRQGPA